MVTHHLRLHNNIIYIGTIYNQKISSDEHSRIQNGISLPINVFILQFYIISNTFLRTYIYKILHARDDDSFELEFLAKTLFCLDLMEYYLVKFSEKSFE